MPSRRYGLTVIVVDASVLAPALGDDGTVGDTARRRLAGESLAAPELIDMETLSVFRKMLRAKKLDAVRAAAATTDLADLPMQRASHRMLVRRCWEMRENLTPYDAAYVALAELLAVSLVTADRGLARVVGIGCVVELVQ
jgi:predicted nucleic acid-binding protein